MSEIAVKKMKNAGSESDKPHKKKRLADSQAADLAVLEPAKKRKKAKDGQIVSKKKKKMQLQEVPAEPVAEDTSTASDDTTLGKEEEVAPARDPLSVENFDLSPSIKKQLAAKSILSLFPIQAQTLDHCLAGLDLVGRAR